MRKYGKIRISKNMSAELLINKQNQIRYHVNAVSHLNRLIFGIYFRDRLFSKYSKFSKKLMFLTP